MILLVLYRYKLKISVPVDFTYKTILYVKDSVKKKYNIFKNSD